MNLIDLVTNLATAAANSDPVGTTEKLLKDYVGKTDSILDALSFLPGVGSDPEQSFYRSKNVSALKVKFAPGCPTPPHDHGTWAVILLLEGEERNVIYRREGKSLKQIKEVILKPGDVLAMRTGGIHVVECASPAPTIGLHVYGGDLPSIARSVWHPTSYEEYVHDESRYAALKAIAAGKQVF